MTHLLLDIENHKQVTIPLIFIAGFLILVSIAGFDDLQQALTYTEIASAVDKAFEDSFIMLGFVAIFLYELVPTVFRLLGTTGFYIGLLDQGINPMSLIIFASVGRLFGWFLLYLLGRFIFNIFKGKNRELADAEHFLHKYRLIVFFLVPFLGFAGDLIVVIAGHQRLGFIRIAPFLFMANLIRYTIWLYVTIGQIELVNG